MSNLFPGSQETNFIEDHDYVQVDYDVYVYFSFNLQTKKLHNFLRIFKQITFLIQFFICFEFNFRVPDLFNQIVNDSPAFSQVSRLY